MSGLFKAEESVANGTMLPVFQVLVATHLTSWDLMQQETDDVFSALCARCSRGLEFGLSACSLERKPPQASVWVLLDVKSTEQAGVPHEAVRLRRR